MLLSTDVLIRYECGGMTIPEIVERDGWRGFRDREFDVVSRVAAFDGGALLDCGGGVVVDLDADGDEIFSERKVGALRRNALVVYLERDVDYLIGRIGHDSARPSLSDTASFEQIMARRDPWYRKAADWVLPCGDLPKTELTERILAWFYERIGAPAPGSDAERS